MSLKTEMRSGRKSLFSIQDFRKLQEEVSVEANLRKIDYTTKKNLDWTRNALLIGMDADVDSSGVAVYDAKDGKVKFYDVIELAYLYEWIREFKRDNGKALERIFVRLEMTGEAVAFGIANAVRDKIISGHKKSGKRLNRIALEKKVFKIVWDSSQNSRVAQEIEKELKRSGLSYELVAPNFRMNVSRNERYKDLTGQQLEVIFRKRITGGGMKWKSMPTKMSAAHMKYFWPELEKAKTMEERDALGLLLPETIWNRMNR